MLCPGKLRFAPALKNREVPHEPRLLFGEEVTNEATSSSQIGGPISSGLESFFTTSRYTPGTPGKSLSLAGLRFLGFGWPGPIRGPATSTTRLGLGSFGIRVAF